MPLDGTGKYHMNPQRAAGADAMAKPAPAPAGDPQGDDPGTLVASIYEKPDGTYCTEDATGQRVEFPDMQSALDSLGPGGEEMPQMPGALPQ